MENSAIVGVGIDLCDVARIETMLTKYGDKFLEKTFSAEEIEYCQKFSSPAQHYAARFAAKEAMVKALGTGFDGAITMKSVCIAKDELNAPVAVLDANAQTRLKEIGANKMLVSLTHLKDYAQAIAIATK